MFISNVDLFFHSKDTNLPVWVELREVVNAYPGPTLIPFGRKVLNPNDINLNATTGTTPTTFTFSTGDIELIPRLLSVSTVKTAGLLNFDKFRARVISQLLSSYLGHKKDHLVYCLVVWKFGEKVK